MYDIPINPAFLPGKGVSLDGNLNLSAKGFDEEPDVSDEWLLLGDDEELEEDVCESA